MVLDMPNSLHIHKEMELEVQSWVIGLKAMAVPSHRSCSTLALRNLDIELVLLQILQPKWALLIRRSVRLMIIGVKMWLL